MARVLNSDLLDALGKNAPVGRLCSLFIADKVHQLMIGKQEVKLLLEMILYHTVVSQWLLERENHSKKHEVPQINKVTIIYC